MAGQTTAKQERVIEAVRNALEGDAAVEHILQGGYAMTVAGIARHLRKLGGRGRVQELLDEGHSNEEVLAACLSETESKSTKADGRPQGELFTERRGVFGKSPDRHSPLYATTKLTVRIPSELSEAIRAAAQGEGKSQNQLIVDLLTSALSREPQQVQQEFEELQD